MVAICIHGGVVCVYHDVVRLVGFVGLIKTEARVNTYCVLVFFSSWSSLTEQKQETTMKKKKKWQEWKWALLPFVLFQNLLDLHPELEASILCVVPGGNECYFLLLQFIFACARGFLWAFGWGGIGIPVPYMLMMSSGSISAGSVGTTHFSCT